MKSVCLSISLSTVCTWDMNFNHLVEQNDFNMTFAMAFIVRLEFFYEILVLSL